MPLIPSRGTTPRHSSLHRGRIIDTPTSPADPVRVVIPAFGTHFWGPLGWAPRIDGVGRAVYPTSGSPCIVALDPQRQPLTVIAWGDGTETGTGPTLADLEARIAALEGPPP